MLDKKNNFNKSHVFDSVAQGTIEYLVIIAVVVVLSLIIVALTINITSSPSQQISTSSEKLGNVAVGGISVVESVSNLEGESLVVLSNNSSDGITLKKISVEGGSESNYDDYIGAVDSVPVNLSGLKDSCPCLEGQKSVRCEFVFEYETRSGLIQREKRTINVQCMGSNERPTPRDPVRVIEPIVFGTLEHPWVINNCVGLQDMNKHLDGNYVLGQDINCYNDTQLPNGALYNGGLGFEPVGKDNLHFVGSFDGGGYTISNLMINRPQTNRVGLFGILKGEDF
ncbi:MAG: hypothetical protein ACOX1V_02200 [Candidatus Iainarchaeum sp.]|jgi:hypothetical protein